MPCTTTCRTKSVTRSSTDTAFDALMDTPVASVTDVERKLAASEHYYRGSRVPHELLDDLLADVRRINGRAI